VTLVGVRGLIHFAAILGLAAVAIAFGRWLRDPQPGGPLLVLGAAALLCALALRRLYRPGGLARAAIAPEAPLAEVGLAEPPPVVDDRLDLNRASVIELRRLPGIGPVGAGRIVEEREANGPYRSVGDLVRVVGFGPSRIRGLGNLVRAG
jgi:competence ComEA-like helix-hairpin-helix protein